MIQHLFSKTALCLYILLVPVLATKLHACTGYDLTFTNVTFTSTNPTYYTYTYQIKNNGTTAVPLNTVVIQNYVSADNTFGGDAAAGGSFIDNNSTAFIAAGATYSGSMWANPGSSTTSTHPYIIIDVHLSSGTDCDASNNKYIGLIQMTTTSTHPAIQTNASVNWNNETKSFTVSNWSGNTTTLQYTILNTSGAAVQSGVTTEDQHTPLNGLKEGIYILYLSDNNYVFSKKILY